MLKTMVLSRVYLHGMRWKKKPLAREGKTIAREEKMIAKRTWRRTMIKGVQH